MYIPFAKAFADILTLFEPEEEIDQVSQVEDIAQDSQISDKQ
jgi:hypothetical protein